MLIGPWDSNAIGTNSPCDESAAHLLLTLLLGSVSIAGNRQPIPKDPLPTVAMIGWHVAAPELQATEKEPDLCYQDGVEV